MLHTFTAPGDTTAFGSTLTAEIRALARRQEAVILAHNYQIPEIQDLADYVGDSLGLAQQAARSKAKVILFAGVHFMAETAAILCPESRVLIPDPAAGCSLADSIDVDSLRNWKSEHPGAIVVSYVNTTAEVKAESDYCCTSGNALKIVQSIAADREILFLPDQFLGSWVKKMTGRKNMLIWMGECHVHSMISPSEIEKTVSEHPQAELLIHPECGCLTPYLDRVCRENAAADADKNCPAACRFKVTSTEGMLRRASESSAAEFVIATETGILHRLKKENPEKTFYAINPRSTCRYMKMITLEKMLHALKEDVYHVSVPRRTAQRARKAIERMVSIF